MLAALQAAEDVQGATLLWCTKEPKLHLARNLTKRFSTILGEFRNTRYIIHTLFILIPILTSITPPQKKFSDVECCLNTRSSVKSFPLAIRNHSLQE